MAEDGCSTKLPTPQLHPWLMISQAKEKANARETHIWRDKFSVVCTFQTNFSEKSNYTTHIPDISSIGIKMMTNCNGWLVLEDKSHTTSSEISLLNIASLEKVKLPKIRWKVLRSEDYVIMNAAPTAPNCFLIIFSPTRSRALIWRRGQQKWVKLGYDPEEQLSHITICNQKMYGIVQSEYFVACDIVDDTLKIKKLGRKPSNKPRELSVSFKYLIGSGDDIFWIQISTHPWNEPQEIEFIDVFKFDQSNETWNQVESIDDRVFFLNGDAHPLSCSVTDSKMKKNCIHFINETLSCNLFSYDMIANKLVVSRPGPHFPYPSHVTKIQFIMVQP